MLVLLESPAGYSLFKVSDESKFQKTDAEDISDTFFSSLKVARKTLDLVSFQPFSDTADAVAAATSCCLEGKVPKGLQKFLQSQLKKDSSSSKLAVADPKLGTSLKEALSSSKKLTIMNDAKTNELFRGIRCYMEELLDESLGIDSEAQHVAMRTLQLGLSHSLSRYKLKFSADKVDTMVIQAVGLLDELDKEINTYAMRTKEWYGWHFPELQALIADNPTYSKLVLKCGMRTNFSTTDLSDILPEETLEQRVKDTAEVSMGTEVADLDIINIQSLAEQVLSMSEYRAQLYEYLKNRMNAIAPNLTILVGELVGARLLSHAGSLMNLAKQPASTIQILGAEKALFRALKTKHATPKYGLIYHASLIGQAAPKNKGKISRVLAAKAALAVRVDALSDDTTADGQDMMVDTTIGYEGRAKVEARLRQLEGGSYRAVVAATGTEGRLTAAKTAKYDPVAAKTAATGQAYNTASDMVLEAKDEEDEEESPKKKKKKSKRDSNGGEDEDAEKSSKKKKKEKKRKAEEEDHDDNGDGNASRAVEIKEEEEPKKKKAKKENGDKEDEEKHAHDPDLKEAKKAAKKAKKEKRKSKD